MRLTERKLAIMTGVFFAAAMTNISQNGDRIVASLAKMKGSPHAVVDTAAGWKDGGSRAAFTAEPRLTFEPTADTVAVLAGASDAPRPATAPQMPPAQVLMARADLGGLLHAVVTADNAAVPQRISNMPFAPVDTAPVLALPSEAAGLSTRLASLDGSFLRPPSDADLDLSPYGTPCAISLSGTAQPGAMVTLSIDAPCKPRRRVEVGHDALRFATRTSVFGRLTLQVPALNTQSHYSVTFADGQTAELKVNSPDAHRVERLVLQWTGTADLNLHAFEYGATEGDTGHVWAGAGRSADHAARVGGGFMVALGDATVDAPMRAQVYTLDRSTVDQQGTIRMMVEARGNDASCDQPVDAISYHASPDISAKTLNIQFEMPPCGEPGQTLLLKNAVQDLRIAQN